MSKLVTPNEIKDAAVRLCDLPDETGDWSDEDWTMFVRFCAANIEAPSVYPATKVVMLVFAAPAEWTEERIDDVIGAQLFSQIVAALTGEEDEEGEW